MGPKRAKTIVKRIAKLKDFLISKFIKTVWYCYKDKYMDQKHKIESLEINYSQYLFFSQGTVHFYSALVNIQHIPTPLRNSIISKILFDEH